MCSAAFMRTTSLGCRSRRGNAPSSSRNVRAREIPGYCAAQCKARLAREANVDPQIEGKLVLSQTALTVVCERQNRPSGLIRLSGSILGTLCHGAIVSSGKYSRRKSGSPSTTRVLPRFAFFHAFFSSSLSYPRQLGSGGARVNSVDPSGKLASAPWRNMWLRKSKSALGRNGLIEEIDSALGDDSGCSSL